MYIGTCMHVYVCSASHTHVHELTVILDAFIASIICFVRPVTDVVSSSHRNIFKRSLLNIR